MKKITFVLILILGFSILKAQRGSLDLSFITEFDFKSFENINQIVIQPDQKILIGGDFHIPYYKSTYGNIIRFNENGSVDTTLRMQTGFNTPGFKIGVNALLVQKDGKILVGGAFPTFNGEKCEKIIRLNMNGILDNSFKPLPLASLVSAMGLQSDNKILIASRDLKGIFKLQRLHADGSLDSSFKTVETDKIVENIFIQADDRILIRGFFATLNKKEYKCIARLNKDGSPDISFNPVEKLKIGGLITCLGLQKDGKVLIGGSIQVNSNKQIVNVVRLRGTGELDTSFNSGNILLFENSQLGMHTIHAMENGKIIVGGIFHTEGEKNRNIICLNANGSIDTSFNTGNGFDNQVLTITGQFGNKLIVSGPFNNFNFYLAKRIVRLNNDELKIKTEEQVFSIFPNPTNGSLSIRSPQTIKQISIIDCIGKEVLRKEPLTNNIEIDLTNKAAGIYFVRVSSEDKTRTQRILKQ